MTFHRCVRCGRNEVKILSNDKFFCNECAKLFGTCAMCEHSLQCDFSTNPTPLPQFVMKHIRQQRLLLDMWNRLKNFLIKNALNYAVWISVSVVRLVMMKKFAACANLVLVRITKKLNFKGAFLRNTLFFI